MTPGSASDGQQDRIHNSAATTWRDWHFGDEPCPFSGGCSEPVRSHYHYYEGPGKPVVVIYYDQPLVEQASRQAESTPGQERRAEALTTRAPEAVDQRDPGRV